MTRRILKYQQIYSELAARLRAGEFLEGQQLPTTRELAGHYQTSMLTVRQAVSELIREKLVFAIQGKGVFAATGACATKTLAHCIHFVAQSTHLDIQEDHFLSLLLLNLCEQAGINQRSVNFTLIPRHQAVADFFRDGFPETAAADGMIFAMPNEAFRGMPERLRLAHIPYALVPTAPCPGAGIPVVRADGLGAWRDGIRTLCNLGHRRIAFFAAPDSFSDIRCAAEAQGVAISPDCLFPLVPWEENSGRTAFRKIRKSNGRFSAIFCSGNEAGIGVFQEMIDCGIRVPEELSVLIYDRYPGHDTVSFRPSGFQQNLRGCAIELLQLLQLQIRSGVEIARDVLIPMDYISGTSCQLCGGDADSVQDKEKRK